ncbi:MAG: ATP-binding protein [Desulfocapsa sp.]|nr:ATP-binding protein [Desulfocapsa sp.]
MQRNIVFDNALEFSADGGDVDLEVSQNGGKTKITVRDTGCGIDDEDLENIFTPFVLEPEKCRPMGFGLNLPLARIMVKALDGRIWAESEGKGRPVLFHIYNLTGETSNIFLTVNQIRWRRKNFDLLRRAIFFYF